MPQANTTACETRVLIFDSGVGGLSILQEIHKQYPGCRLFYSSDNQAFPYGIKPIDALVDRVDEVLHRLQQHTQANIIVVACNTASTVALPRIRERFKQPVIGVVPAIKPAAQISQSKAIGLLATPGTVTRTYTDDLIEQFAKDCEVVRVGSNELVLLAEKKLRGETIHTEELSPIIAPFKDHGDIDTVVLACTHFPLLKQELQAVLPNIRHWVDSGEAIARRVGHWMKEHQLGTAEVPQDPHYCAYFTQKDKNTQSLEKNLAPFFIKTVKYLDY